MAIKSVEFLKNSNSDFNNILDSYLNIAEKDNGNVQTLKGYKNQVINVNSTPFQIQVSSSGATFVVSSSAGALTTSLPAVADCSGFHCSIVTKDNTAHIISQSAGDNSDKLYGNIMCITGSTAAAGSGSLLNGNQKITLGGKIGDRLTFEGDGTNWYVAGTVNNHPVIA